MMRRHFSRPLARRGFTLIELLVAISILAIVAVLGWRGLDGIVRSRVTLTEQLEATRGMQLAFAQMQSDCEHMAAPSSLQSRPYLLSDNEGMTLVRDVYLENEPSRLQVVAYRVRDGVLTRRESVGTRDLNQLDVLWKAATSNGDTTPPVTLQTGVNGITVQVWDNGVWRLANQPQQQQQAVTALQQLTQAAAAAPPGGLNVILQVKNVPAPMSKAFLLGGI